MKFFESWEVDLVPNAETNVQIVLDESDMRGQFFTCCKILILHQHFGLIASDAQLNGSQLACE